MRQKTKRKKQVDGRRPTHKGGRKRVRTLPKRPSVLDRGDALRLDQCAQDSYVEVYHLNDFCCHGAFFFFF